VNQGYTTGLRLLQATCKVFTTHCQHAGVLQHTLRGFEMSFVTNIPRMVGLSGSSAIIVATFNALLRYYGLSLDDLHIAQEDYPEVILSIERDELGISAGLQDRVIQTYGGLVHMDFTRSEQVHIPFSTITIIVILIAIDATYRSNTIYTPLWIPSYSHLSTWLITLRQEESLARCTPL